MAFNPNRKNSNTAASTDNDSWKAQGFINIFLPSKAGGRRKLGSIALKESNDNQKLLLDWLNADEGNAAKLAAAMIVEFQSATPDEGTSFDLPV